MFTVNDIGKNYKKKIVLNHISLQVAPGECVGLLGINGSGKSTILKIITGVLTPLSGLDNLKLWYSGRSAELNSTYSLSILKRLGVDAFLHQKVSTMSGGMKKRLSLAICMLEQPDLLLLDEPLAALDLLCKKGILDYLKEYTGNGGSIIVATHEEDALSICNRIYILKDGLLQEAKGTDYAAMLRA